MLKITVPTIFTAVDKLSPVINKIGSGISNFAEKAERTAARANRAFNKLTPTLSKTTKQLFDFASKAAIASAIVGGIMFSGKAIADYEVSLHSLQAVTGASYKIFENQIESIAKKSKKSSIEVAQSFEIIGSAMSQYLQDPKALGQITEAGITLAKASRQELAPTLDNLTNIMNQFKLSAGDAQYAINRLTAGEIVGSMRTSEVAASLQEFGASAKLANVNLGESVALTEVLGRQMQHGMVGNAGKNILVILQAAKGLAARARKELAKNGVNSAILMDNKLSLGTRLTELSKILKDPVAMVKVFGRENLTAGQIILNNLKIYKDWEAQIKTTNQAQAQAGVNTDTLTNRITELKNTWTTYITTNDKAKDGLDRVKSVILFITDHMDSLLSIGLKVLGFFAVWKALLIGTNIALGVYNIAIGITGALTGVANIAIGQSPIALAAYRTAMVIATAVTWLWNAALAANPIVWVVAAIVAGIAAVIAIVYYWGDITKWFSKIWADFSAWIITAWDSIVNSFKNFSFKNMFMEIGKSIMDFFLFPLKLVLSLAAKLPGTIGNASAGALSMIDKFSANMDVNHSVDDPKPALGTPQQNQYQMMMAGGGLNHNMNINLNDPGNMVNNTQVNGPFSIPVKVTNTQGQK